jgi:hypothetical protein
VIDPITALYWLRYKRQPTPSSFGKKKLRNHVMCRPLESSHTFLPNATALPTLESSAKESPAAMSMNMSPAYIMHSGSYQKQAPFEFVAPHSPFTGGPWVHPMSNMPNIYQPMIVYPSVSSMMPQSTMFQPILHHHHQSMIQDPLAAHHLTRNLPHLPFEIPAQGYDSIEKTLEEDNDSEFFDIDEDFDSAELSILESFFREHVDEDTSSSRMPPQSTTSLLLKRELQQRQQYTTTSDHSSYHHDVLVINLLDESPLEALMTSKDDATDEDEMESRRDDL